MPRALWSGSLSFGLVNVPVALVTATVDVDLHFRQIHEKDGSPIETRRFCEQEDVEIPYEEIGHGYEREDGSLVVLTDDELDAVAPERTRTIEVQAFVDLPDVDPVYFDSHYLVAPTGDGQGPRRAYQLLVEVMRRTERAALARFVLRTREHLALVRERDGVLVLTTMLFHDEIRPTKGIGSSGAKPSKQALEQAVGLIEALAVGWDPSRYEDRYRARLEDVVKRKKQGERITIPKDEDQPAPVPDLMAALQRSLEAARSGRRATAGGDGGDELEDLTKDELYARAQDADVPGRSSMSKDELVSALRD